MLVRVQEEALDEREVRDHVSRAANGAVLVFHGVVRDHHEGKAVTHIDYQAYRSMAERELAAVARDCAERFELDDVAVLHRVGPVRVGEASLLVALGHAHRQFVFEGGLWLIDELKRRVPIWKKEFGPDGTHWVEGVLPTPRGEEEKEDPQSRSS